MGLDGERQKQHRHSGRVGARPDQFDGRRHSAGTLQHFTCPLFHRWVDFVFFFIWVWSFLTLTFGGQETTAASGCWKVLTPRWWRCSSPTMTSPSWLPSGRSRSTSAPSSPYRRDSPGESVQLTPCPILLLFPPPLGGCNTSILFSFMAIILWAAANQSYNNNLRRQGTGGNHPDRLDRFVNCIPFSPLVLLPCLSHNGVCVICACYAPCVFGVV